MKSIPSLFLLALLVAARTTAFAQDSGDGTIRIKTVMHPDGTKTISKTDPTEHIAETDTYDASGKMQQKIVFNLDEQGQTTGGTVYSAKGVLLYKMIYKFDTSKRVTEVQNMSPAGRLVSRQVYHYDSNNRVTKIDTFDASGNLIASPSAPAGRPDPKRAK